MGQARNNGLRQRGALESLSIQFEGGATGPGALQGQDWVFQGELGKELGV